MNKPDKESREQRARAGPKKTTGGNIRADREWLEELMEAGEITRVEPDDRPKDVLDDVIYQWSGFADEIDENFFLWYRRPLKATGEIRRCSGEAYIRDERGGYILDAEWHRIRRPCLANPSTGATVCQSHGGRIPAVRAKAQRVITEASEVVALRLVGLTATKDEDGDTIEHKVRLAAANSVLDRAGIKGGVEIEVTLPGYKKIMGAMFGAEEAEGDD